MELDRRTLLAGGTAALTVGPALARPRSAGGSWYDRAIVIDALGSAGDPYTADDVTRMSDRGWAETVATGVTMVRSTVFPVGNTADPWGDYKKGIGEAKAFLEANPDRVLLVRSAADILKAKRNGRFGVLLGTQDSCMIGPDLDRLVQMKKDGVMTVQLTYNNGNLAGDVCSKRATAASPNWVRRQSNGSNRKSSCSTSVTAAHGPWPRRRHSPNGRW